MTRNPYAGMLLVPMFLTLVGRADAGIVAGVAVGAVHGALRAGGVVYNVSRLRGDVHLALLALFGWRLIDGLALLAIGGYVLGTLG